MLKLLILILFALPTFAQSLFWKMELMESATTPSAPDILTDLVALWQDGDTTDATGRGNDLTRSHTNPTPLPDAWDDEIAYNTGDLCTHLGYVFRSKQDGKTYQPEAPGAEDEWWTVHAPYKTATGLAGIDSAITFNGIDHYLSRASTTDLQLGETDFTIAVWVKLSETQNAYILSKDLGGSDYFLKWGDDGYFGGIENLGNEPILIQNTNWSFFVVTLSGDVKVFANGELKETATIEPYTTNTAGVFYVSNYNDGDQYYLNGSIAQLAIYKRALTAEQITYLYNGGDGRLINP